MMLLVWSEMVLLSILTVRIGYFMYYNAYVSYAAHFTGLVTGILAYLPYIAIDFPLDYTSTLRPHRRMSTLLLFAFVGALIIHYCRSWPPRPLIPSPIHKLPVFSCCKDLYQILTSNSTYTIAEVHKHYKCGAQSRLSPREN